MKNWTLKVALLTVATLALTACPDKKGGGAVAVPPGTGTCTLDQNGQCVGGTVFSGGGRWSGPLYVSPMQMPLYRTFLIENGLCHSNRNCNAVATQWVGVSMKIIDGRARVKITPYSLRGWARKSLNRRGNSYVQNGGAGFQIEVRDDNYYISSPHPIVAPNTGSIQLIGNFTTPYGDLVTTNLYYRGVIIASGQVPGRRNLIQHQQPPPAILPGN